MAMPRVQADFSFSSFAASVASLLRRCFSSLAFARVTWGCSHHCQLLELFWVLLGAPTVGLYERCPMSGVEVTGVTLGVPQREVPL